MALSPAQVQELQRSFFELIFTREQSGFVCIAASRPTGNYSNGKVRDKESWKEVFFPWPTSDADMLDFITENQAEHNLYFCPTLYTGPVKSANYTVNTNVVWADLDTCSPDILDPKPSIAVETSPARYHGYWIIGSTPSRVAEDYAKRIARRYKDHGVDQSGWDITQLLRVPYTRNLNYAPKFGEHPAVKVLYGNDTKTPVGSFETLPPIEGESYDGKIPLPSPDDLPSADRVMELYHARLSDNFISSLTQPPAEDADWSRILWRVLMMAFEAGMNRNEVLAIANTAACNKWERDNRPITALWQDVLRAEAAYENVKPFTHEDDFDLPIIVTDKEPRSTGAFVEDYTGWAKDQSDSPTQYHDVGAMIALSGILADKLELHTGFGIIKPNIWAILVADTTLTRKTTAMDMVMDLLDEIDPEIRLATDGSMEGIVTAMALAPGRSAILHRDEFTGFIDAVAKKDYMAGALETLTKLYDGKPIKRVLRSETIFLKEPLFILFAGSIRKKFFQIVNESHVHSGFLPRFIFVSAAVDLSRMRPMGPPTNADIGKRVDLIQRLTKLNKAYYREREVGIPGTKNEVVRQRYKIKAMLTTEAWARYNEIETNLIEAGYKSADNDIYTPLLDRLSKSGLKIAMLLSASRQEPENDEITVTVEDINLAAHYIQQWAPYTLEVADNIGKGALEMQFERALKMVKQNPGIYRSDIMRAMHLSAQQASIVFDTLQRRDQIREVKKERAITLWPT